MRIRGRPLSLAVLRIADRPETLRARAGGWLERAVPQIGSMVGRLVRAEDTAGRIAPEIFGLALPGAAFQAGQNQRPFTVDFEVGAAELRPGESAGHALERAAAQFAPRKAS